MEGEAEGSLDADDATKLKHTTFLRWLNWRLRSGGDLEPDLGPVTDLSYDLRSGVVLHHVLGRINGHHSQANPGETRLDRLGNMESLFNLLQKERCKLVEEISKEKILEGNLEETLRLIWIIIVRFELQARFVSREWESFSLDQILISWIKLTVANLGGHVLRSHSQLEDKLSRLSASFTQMLQDGVIICYVLLGIDSNLAGLVESLDQDVSQRWTLILRLALNRFQVPQLLNVEDIVHGKIDKDCLLLYLSLLYLKVTPESVTPLSVENMKIPFNPDLPATFHSSPVKQKLKIRTARMEVGGLQGWQRNMEDVLSWILEAEEHLLSMHSLGHRNLQVVRTKFYNHEDFMLELQNHQNEVGKVLSCGKDLVSTLTDPQQQVEIRLQNKILVERWEKVRNLAMKKQSELHQLIMNLQMDQISDLKQWMTGMEDKISRLEAPGDTVEVVELQLQEAERLQGDLETQHAAVSSISNFILVETEEDDGIEDQLAGVGERWSMICRCVEERLEVLRTTLSILTNLAFLQSYLAQVTRQLKEMENTLDLDNIKIQQQDKQIKEIETSLSKERSRLSQIDLDFDTLQMRSQEMSPQLTRLAANLENLHDSWGVVVEIVFAQKSRLDNLSSHSNKQTNKDQGDEKVGGKRARLSQDVQADFEKCYARILSWSETILSRLDHQVITSLPFQDQNLLLEESGAEVVSGKQLLCSLLKLSIQLDQGVSAEDPGAVNRQVQGATHQLDKVKARIQALKSLLDYQVEKEYLDQLSEDTGKIIKNITSFIDECEQVEDECVTGQLVDQARERHRVVESVGVKLEQIQRIGARLAQHSGADACNTVKQDLETLCQSFQSVEAKFSSLIRRLEGSKDQHNSQQNKNCEELGSSVDLRTAEACDNKTVSEDRKSLQDIPDPDYLTSDGKSCQGNPEPDYLTSDKKSLQDTPEPDYLESDKKSCQDKPDPEYLTSDGKSLQDTPEPDYLTSDRRSLQDTPDPDYLESDRKSCQDTPDPDDLTSEQQSENRCAADNYEECTVNATIAVPAQQRSSSAETGDNRCSETESAEAFIRMSNTDTKQEEADRETSQLEMNLDRCDKYLQQQFYLEDTSSLEDVISQVHTHLKLLADAFVPANLTDDEASLVLDRLLEVKKRLRSREKEARCLLDDVTQVREEISGLSLWMKEVDVFLAAEEPALGDLDTLEAQLKESNALQEDIVTLEPNISNIQHTGANLISRCAPGCKLVTELDTEMRTVVASWRSTVDSALNQNQKLKTACHKTREVLELIKEINNFLDQLEQELPIQGVVTDAPELSQRTYKLLQLRDKTDRKTSVLNRLSSTVSQLIDSESEGEAAAASVNNTAAAVGDNSNSKPSLLEIKLNEVQSRWSTVTEPVSSQYTKMREASTDYGEFKTLVAQESDWLDRLEKKLRRSSKCAADAEEICEELDDLENCINNRPAHRLNKLKTLAASLSEKDVLISPVQTEADRLEKRWETLESHTKKRIRSLEECITEAQEWECKILAVQDWLAEKDAILSSHLEHELTAQDLPDETQRELLLREFEDKENILSAMDEQVDAYREAGKEEAATRLEDQLILIHAKFQELSSKFELFQQPSDYNGKLGRITRQLKDIQRNMYLTELISHEPESIHGQLHHTRCIYNALADIKPEVESTIKMGRKLVDSGSVPDGPDTTRKIDALKELFNVLGAQVTESREILQRALELSEQFGERLHRVNVWLKTAKSQLDTMAGDKVKGKLKEMRVLKNDVNILLALKQDFLSLCNDESCLTGLKDSLKILYSEWAAVLKIMNSKLTETSQVTVGDLDLSEDEVSRVLNATNGSMNSSGSGDESMLLSEFRGLFQEISHWLEATEDKLNEKDDSIGDQVINYQPKVEQLGDMASRLLEKYSNNKTDIEPEMEQLGYRWETILVKIQNNANKYHHEVSSNMMGNVKAAEVLETLPEEPETVEETEKKVEKQEIIKEDADEVNACTTPEAIEDKPNTPTDVITTSATSDPEEISTLPEDSYRSAAYNVTNSRGSSPEYINVDRSSASPQRNISDNKESSPSKIPRKIPPPTKPKPQWYIDSVRTVHAESRPIPVDVTFVPKPTKPSSIPVRSHDVGSKVPVPPEPGSVAPPVQQVTVSITSLPLQTPQTTDVVPPPVNHHYHHSSAAAAQQVSAVTTTVACTVVQPEINTVACSSPVSTVLPSVDTSPTTLSPVEDTQASTLATAPQSILDDIDKQNAKDNEIIDRLLRSASEDIEDVRIRSYTSSRSQQKENHEHDVKEFKEKFDSVASRMTAAKEKLNRLESESEFPVRNDLIDLEVNELEADVATTISRGDTLVLMVHRFNIEQGEELKSRVTNLREQWNELKSFAEEKKAKAAKESETLKILRDKLERMKNWLDSVIKIIRSKKSEEERINPARKEVDRKASEIKMIETIVSTIKPIDKLGDMKEILIAVRADWEVLKDLATPARRSKSKSPGVKPDRAVPDELFTRTIRVQEALAAVKNQLDTSILNERNYENLELQAHTLDKVKEALDTLRPKVKKTMSDMDHISGGLSMEYFDKLTAMGEKLRGDWKQVNDRYVERRSVWRLCDQEMRAFTSLEYDLNVWLADIEQFIKDIKKNAHDSEPASRLNTLTAEVQSTEQRVRQLADIGTKISGEIGATQARDIFTRYDTIRKRWRCVYTELNLHRQESEAAGPDINANVDENTNNNVEIEPTTLNSDKIKSLQQGDNKAVASIDSEGNEEDLANSNLNGVLVWCDQALAAGSELVNPSDIDALNILINRLKQLIQEASGQRSRLENLGSSVGQNCPQYLSSQAKLQKINFLLPKKLATLREKSDRLHTMTDGLNEKNRFVQDLQTRFDAARSNEEVNTVKVAIGEIEYSIQRLFSDFSLLEKEVEAARDQKVRPNLVKDIAELRTKWSKLNSEVKQKQFLFVPGGQATSAKFTSGSSTAKDIAKTSSSYSVCSIASQASAVSSASQTASEWACRSTNTGTSEQWATSPTTGTNSPMSEEAEEPTRGPTRDDGRDELGHKTASVLAFVKNLTTEMGSKRVDVMDTELVGKELDRIRSLISHLDSKKQLKNELMVLYEGSADHNAETKHEMSSSWAKLHQTLMGRKTELTTMLEHTDNLQSKGKEVADWLTRLEGMLAGAGVGKTKEALLKQTRDVNQIHRELQQYAHHVALLSQACNRLISIYSRDDTSRISEKNQELTGRYSALTSGCTARGKSLQAALHLLNKRDQDLEDFLAWISQIETKLVKIENGETTTRLEDVLEEVRAQDSKFQTISSSQSKSEEGEDSGASAVRLSELKRRWTELQNSMLNLASAKSKEEEENVRKVDKVKEYIKEKTSALRCMDVGKCLTEIEAQIAEHDKFREELKMKEESIDQLPTSCTINLKQEWKKLKDLADEWDSQLQEAEEATKRVEDAIGAAEGRIGDLETASTEWSLPPSLDTAGAEREELESTLSGLNHVEELVLSAKMQSDTKPYIQVGERLATLERRLTALKESAAHRREQLSCLVIQVDPGNQEFLKESVPSGWERCLTEENIPYYSHHVQETTSWDHPEFTSLLESISVMNTVKYCAYRVALKLRKIQQRLCLDLLDIEAAVVCFDSHGLTADKHDLSVAVPEIVTILTSIYETLYQCEPEEVDVPTCVDLCLNWLLNVFDSQRTGFVRVLSLKVGIAVMCRGPLEDKYRVMFELATGGEKRLDQRRLGLLVYDCVQIPKYLGEIALFGGSNIEPSVRSCLRKSSQINATYVDRLEFIDWLAEEPQSLVWLPVLHRLASAETATHDVRCKVCRSHPIIGFRYHCKKCFNLDICHGCFFLGKNAKGHKPEHPMIEYCTPTNKTDNARHLLQAFRNSFRSRKYFKKKQSKLGYLPVQSIAEGDNFESPALSPNLSWESREFPASITESTSSKLAGGETSGSLTSKPEEDEHFLIASYCRMLTNNNNNHLANSPSSLLHELDSRLDTMEKEEVEQVLNQLQEENNRLQTEYQELLTSNLDSQQANPAQEEKSLRQQKNRLEARLAILEDHNRQLEAQLDRLRQFVQPEPVSPASSGNTRFVVAAELHEGEGVAKKGEGMMVRPPPTHASKKAVAEPGSGRRVKKAAAADTDTDEADKIVVDEPHHNHQKLNGDVGGGERLLSEAAKDGDAAVARSSSTVVEKTVGGDEGLEKRFSGESEMTGTGPSNRNSLTSGSLNLSQHTLESQYD